MSTETTQTKSPLDSLKKAAHIFKEIYLTLLIIAGRIIAFLFLLGSALALNEQRENMAYRLCAEDTEAIGAALNKADAVMEQVITNGCGVLQQINTLTEIIALFNADIGILLSVKFIFLIEILAYLKTWKE